MIFRDPAARQGDVIDRLQELKRDIDEADELAKAVASRFDRRELRRLVALIARRSGLALSRLVAALEERDLELRADIDDPEEHRLLLEEAVDGQAGPQ